MARQHDAQRRTGVLFRYQQPQAVGILDASWLLRSERGNPSRQRREAGKTENRVLAVPSCVHGSAHQALEVEMTRTGGCKDADELPAFGSELVEFRLIRREV